MEVTSQEKQKITSTHPKNFQALEKALAFERFGQSSDFFSKRHLTTAKPTSAKSSSIESIPPQGLVIEKPGTYRLKEHVSWTPSTVECLEAAITINCSDVTLDLCGHTLTVEAHRGIATAILIGSSDKATRIKDIKVINGEIKGAVYAGVLLENTMNVVVQDTLFNQLSFHQLDLSDVVLETLLSTHQHADAQIPLLCPAPVVAQASQGLILEHCLCKELHYTANNSAGIFLMACSGVMIKSCVVNTLINKGGVSAGYFYMLCSNVVTTDSQALHCRTEYHKNIQFQLNSLGHTAIGFMPVASFGLSFNHCESRHIHGCCDDCHGMSLFVVLDANVNQFFAFDIKDGFTSDSTPQEFRNTGAKATGLEIYGNNITVTETHVREIIAKNPQDLQSAGFSSAGNHIVLINCHAEDVQVVDDDNHPQANDTVGYGVGFGWAPDPREAFCHVAAEGVQYVNCEAKRCQVGFDNWCHQDSYWLDWKADKCDIAILQQESTRKLTYNYCSECMSHQRNQRKSDGKGGDCKPTILENTAKNNYFLPFLEN
ncbi:MAG: hypothetical protein AAGB12_16295 [Pseudomonadota bacterium]